MFRSYEVSSVNTIFWAFVVATLYSNDWRLGALITIGVALAVSFNPLTSYFTSTEKTPVKEIVKSTRRTSHNHPIRISEWIRIIRLGSALHRN